MSEVMRVGKLKNLIRDLPDDRPVIVLVNMSPYNSGGVIDPIYAGSGTFQSCQWGVSLCLYTLDVDGLEPTTKEPVCVADPEYVDVDEFVRVAGPAEEEPHWWGPPPSTALAVIDSDGKPGASRGTSDLRATDQKIMDKLLGWLRFLLN